VEQLSIAKELALVEKAKTDIASFEVLYEMYFPIIFRYCRSRLATHECAEDVVSTVFLKAVKNIKKFDTTRKVRFLSWLYRTAHNTIIDYSKRGSRSKSIQLDSMDSAPEGRSMPRDAAVVEENRQMVVEVLKKIKPRYQLVITLKYFEEMENHRIAPIVGVREKQVPVLLHRALKSFRRKFGKQYGKSEIFNLDNRYISNG